MLWPSWNMAQVAFLVHLFKIIVWHHCLVTCLCLSPRQFLTNDAGNREMLFHTQQASWSTVLICRTCSFLTQQVFVLSNQWNREPLEGNGVWQITIILKRYYFGFKIKAPLEHIWVSFNEADEPRVYYTEWSESEREKKYWILTHIYGS